MVEVRLLVDSRNHLGEGPVWDVAEQRLYWVDSSAAELWCCDAQGGQVRTWFLPGHVGAMALRAGGGAVLALQDGFHTLDFATRRFERIAPVDHGAPARRMNDGKVDRRGRFLAGSMGYDHDPDYAPRGRRPASDATLYRLDPGHGLHALESGIGISNGPCWSPDDRTFYFSDSLSRSMYAYDYDIETGAIGNRRLFASNEGYAGTFDGSTVDADGFVWNAHVFGGCLVRYAPDGRIDRVVDMPVRNVTSVMFGGPGLDTLYVTSMGRPVRGVPQKEAAAGGVFAVHGLGVRGLPETRFAG